MVLDYFEWASGSASPKDVVTVVEYRLICSGVLKPGDLEGDWTKSDGARLLLREPVKLIVTSQRNDEFPQELVLRFKSRWGELDDAAIANELSALLTLLCRRLVTVYTKTRTLFDRETLPAWTGLHPWMCDWPAPIAGARLVCWKPRPAIVTTGKNSTEVRFNDPAPGDFDADFVGQVLACLPDLDCAAILTASRLENESRLRPMSVSFVIDNQAHRLANVLNDLLAQTVGKPFGFAMPYFSQPLDPLPISPRSTVPDPSPRHARADPVISRHIRRGWLLMLDAGGRR